jgi:N-acetylglucosaminyldiphosphoundecaprenol N-acetyl-beta-D-mannosaminyltransferase
MGIEYQVSTLPSATDAVLERARSGLGGYGCLAGVHGVITAKHSPNLRSAFDSAWVTLPDGEPVAWMMRRLGARQTRRVAGPDLMARVMDEGRAYEIRHFLLGSTSKNLVRLESRLIDMFPGVSIVGTYSPPFRQLSVLEERGIVDDIRSSRAQIVWVGLGLPKQDEWMASNAPTVESLCLGVGAAFDFLSGNKQRAPLWMRKRGLEWLHRLLSEPRRLGWRYARTNSEFILLASGSIARHWAHRLVPEREQLP